LWMVDDGLAVDKIILASDSQYVPTGSGPQEGDRAGSPAPVVTITSPADGTLINVATQAVKITATAPFGRTITNIQLFVNNVLAGQGVNSPFTVTLSNLQTAASYELTAVATDSAGATRYSPIVIFSVLLPPRRYVAGDLVVMQYGNGSESLSASSGQSMFFAEYKTDGTVVQSIPITNSGPNAMCGNSSSASEGYLGVSPGGNLVFSGYNIAPGVNGNVSGALPSAVPRAVGRMGTDGHYSIVGTITNLPGDVNGNSLNARCAISDDTNYWYLIGGSNGRGNGSSGTTSGGGGIYLLGLTPNPIVVNTNFPNPKHALIHDGNLYFTSFDDSAHLGTNRGLWAFNGKPLGAANPVPVVNNTNMNSMWGMGFS